MRPVALSMPRNQLRSWPDSDRPFVTSGIAVIPPVPLVVAGEPVPSRRNHVSIVKVSLLRPGAAPNVTWSSTPSKSRADPAAADGVAVAAFDTSDSFPPSSTAVTVYS